MLKKSRGPSGPSPSKPEVAVFSGKAKADCPKKLDFLEAFNMAQSATLIPRVGEGATEGLATLTLFGVSERTLLYSHACPMGNVEKNAIRSDAMQLRTRDFAELFLSGEAIGQPGRGAPSESRAVMEDAGDDIIEDEGLEDEEDHIDDSFVRSLAGPGSSLTTAIFTGTSAQRDGFTIRIRVLAAEFMPAGREAGDYEGTYAPLSMYGVYPSFSLRLQM